MAIGSETLYIGGLPEELQVGRLKQEFNFRSVHGKSTTSHVATIPTSLGKQGSVLKPAIFTGENSEKAPFWISLPFLLSCRTVLHLDPSHDLRAEFKQLGFSVKCHIGPTGASRIPLANFNEHQLKKLKQAQKEIQKKPNFEEFEVLRTEHVVGDESEAPVGSKPSSPENCSNGCTPCPNSHGARGSSQEEPLRGERGQLICDRVVATDGGEAALPAVPGDNNADASGLCQGGPHQPQQALQCLEEQAYRDGRHRERDDARDVRPGEPAELSTGVGTSITDTQSCPEHDEFNYSGALYLTQYQIEKCGEPPLCQHGRACHLWITKKEGPNHGRVFWRCPENRANQCKTFVWCSFQPEWKEESPVRSRSQESATTYSSRTSKGRSSGTMSSNRPQRLNDPRTCPHTDTVKTGTNAFVIKERCRQCNTMVVDRKRTKEEIEEMHQRKTAASSASTTPATIDAETEAELKAFFQWRQGRGQNSGSKSRPS